MEASRLKNRGHFAKDWHIVRIIDRRPTTIAIILQFVKLDDSFEMCMIVLSYCKALD